MAFVFRPYREGLIASYEFIMSILFNIIYIMRINGMSLRQPRIASWCRKAHQIQKNWRSKSCKDPLYHRRT